MTIPEILAACERTKERTWIEADCDRDSLARDVYLLAGSVKSLARIVAEMQAAQQAAPKCNAEGQAIEG